MTSLKYRDKTFEVKDNTLGIGKVISELSAKFEDELIMAQYFIIRMPDFDRYQTIMNEISVLGSDLKVQTDELKKLKGKEKTKQEGIINTLAKALQSQYEALEESAIQLIFNRMVNIRKEVRFGFENDLETFKTLCNTLLLGDVKEIDYSTVDKDLAQLRDGVYDAFFSIRNRIYSARN